MKAQRSLSLLTLLSVSLAAPLASASESGDPIDHSFPVETCVGTLGKRPVTIGLYGSTEGASAYLDFSQDEEGALPRFSADLKLHEVHPQSGERTYTIQSVYPDVGCVMEEEHKTTAGKVLNQLKWAITDLTTDIAGFVRRKLQYRMRIHTDGNDVWITRDGKGQDFRCE